MKIENGRTERLEIRLQAAEKEAFQMAAEFAGVPLAAWIRERLRRVARNELEDAGKQAPFLGTR